MSGRYDEIHRRSLAEPDAFWGEAAEHIHWFRRWDRVLDNDNPPFSRWFVGGETNIAYNALDRHVAAGRGDQAALLYESPVTNTELRLTYRQLRDRVALFAGALAAKGVARGDRVVIYMPMVPEAVVAMLACVRLGAIHSVVFGGFAANELATRIDDAKPKLIVSASCGIEGQRVIPYKPLLDAAIDKAGHKPDACIILQRPMEKAALKPGRDTGWEEAVAAASAADCVPVKATDPSYILYTSGTTGRPKGVMLTHWNLRAMTLAYALDVDQPGPEQATLYAAPVSHGAGLYNFIFVRVGARHVFTPSRGFEANEIEALSRHFGAVVMFAAPTMVKRMIEAAKLSGWRGEGLRSVIYGGGPMYAADIDEALALFGPRFVQIYGQGETPMTITSLRRDLVADNGHPGWRARRASVGQAMACVELRIADGGVDMPAGEPGEILVRGATVMKGYWRNEKATAETLRGGWLHTGDIGALDADGFLTLTDRAKDLIISGGTNIYPREVEEVLARHPGVLEVSVVGRPNAEWGEDVVAFVVPRGDGACDAAGLEAWCRAEIASFKKPKDYIFCAELPKNSYGKVLKTELRGRFQG